MSLDKFSLHLQRRKVIISHCCGPHFNQGVGGNVLTMTPSNLTHGQWSYCSFCAQISKSNQRFTISAMENLYFGQSHGQYGYFCAQISWQILRFTILTMENLDFGHGLGRNFDHLTIVIPGFGHGHGQKFLTT